MREENENASEETMHVNTLKQRHGLKSFKALKLFPILITVSKAYYCSLNGTNLNVVLM